MRRKSVGKRLETTEIDGKSVKIGDIVPIPAEKLTIRPLSFVDDPKKGPRGVFRSGRGKARG